MCFFYCIYYFLLPLAVQSIKDADRTTVEIIQSRGFIAEDHYVNTYDGYVLNLHRIVNPLIKGPKKLVFLQHGLISSSSCFVINSADGHLLENTTKINNNLGFALAKAGYDVWLGNSRGNRYSSNHTILKSTDDAFWEFTFNEMAQYDLPASIHYVLQQTNTNSLSYIGHSQGTAILFALLSEKAFFAKYINLFIALSPVAFLANTKSPVIQLADNLVMDSLLSSRGQFFVTETVSQITANLCEKFRISLHITEIDSRIICRNIFYVIVGYNPAQTNITRVKVYMHHIPTGTSNWNVRHFLQLIRSKTFAKYDAGTEVNVDKYGTATPPAYKLEKIKNVKIALIYSKNDLLVDIKDVNLLKKTLKVKLFDEYIVPDPNWNHMDFLFGIDAGKYVNAKVLELLKNSV